jgi:RecB family endonuclease NucS
MARLYALINECARKTTPTARAHYQVAATVKNWEYAVEARIDRAKTEAQDQLTLRVTNLRTRETVEVAADEIAKVFAAAKAKQQRAAKKAAKRAAEEAALTRAVIEEPWLAAQVLAA